MKSPIGKYYKTMYAHYYCYGRDKENLYTCIRIEEDAIERRYYADFGGLPESTREEFMAAYARTIKAINSIVEGGK